MSEIIFGNQTTQKKKKKKKKKKRFAAQALKDKRTKEQKEVSK
jgi:hypothetical protein